jgi:hypothetical protein
MDYWWDKDDRESNIKEINYIQHYSVLIILYNFVNEQDVI